MCARHVHSDCETILITQRFSEPTERYRLPRAGKVSLAGRTLWRTEFTSKMRLSRVALRVLTFNFPQNSLRCCSPATRLCNRMQCKNIEAPHVRGAAKFA